MEATMNIHIQWQDAAKKVVRLECSGAWNRCELDARMDHWRESYALLSESLCILVDVRQVTAIPNDAILYLKSIARFVQNTDTMIVVIAANAAAVTTFNLFVTMYKSVGNKLHLVSDDSEALALITAPA